MSVDKGLSGVIWTRNFILLWFGGLFLATSYYVMLPILPLYLDSLSYDESDIGVIVGMFTFSATLIRPLAGYWIDKYGRKYFYLGSLLFFGLFMQLYGFITTFVFLILLRILHGFSWGLMSTSGSTVAADILPAKRRGEGMGYYYLTLSVAMAVGPAVSLALLESGSSYQVLFIGGGMLAVFGVLITSRINYPEINNIRVTLSWKNIFEKRVLALAVVMFLVALTYGVIITFIPIYGNGIEEGGAIWFYVVYAISLALIRPFSGRILDRHGPKWLVSFSLLVMGSGYLVLVVENTWIGLALSGALVGLGSGVTLPAVGALVANRVEDEARGRANGTYHVSLDVGIGMGAIIFGVIAQYINMQAVFIGAFIVSILAMIQLLFWVIPKGLYLPYKTKI